MNRFRPEGRKDDGEENFKKVVPPTSDAVFLKHWQAVNHANEIFGFNGWNSKFEGVYFECFNKKNEQILPKDGPEHITRLVARAYMTVSVKLDNETTISHTAPGYQIAQNLPPARMFMSGKKGAVSDALKACLNILFAKVSQAKNSTNMRNQVNFDHESPYERAIRKKKMVYSQVDDFRCDDKFKTRKEDYVFTAGSSFNKDRVFTKKFFGEKKFPKDDEWDIIK